MHSNHSSRRPRLAPMFAAALALGLAACSEPPKPEKAENLDKIQPEEKKAGSSAASDLPPIPSGPVAVVGGVEIPNEAFRKIYDLKLKKYEDRGRQIPTSSDRRYRKSIVERLIYQEILRQEAEKQGVSVDEAKVQERLDAQKKGIQDWAKHLERRGETEDSLKAMFRAELIEKALLEKAGKLEVTEAEVQEEYEKIKNSYKSDKPRVRASHILIPVGPKDRLRPKPGEKPPEPSDEEKKKWEAEAMAKAEEVYAKAKAPDADFAALAREYSSGPSAPKGGDLGIFTEDRMVEEFAKTAFSLKPGQVSKPVKTKFGLHIIKVYGKWGPGELPLEAIADQIRDRLAQRKLYQGKREMKTELIGKYEVKDNIAPTLGPEPSRPKPRPVRKPPVAAAPGKADAKAAPKDPASDSTKAPPTGAKAAGAAVPGK